MPSKIIYRIDFINDDTIIELTKQKLRKKLKTYIDDHNLKDAGWFYLSDYKINKLFTLDEKSKKLKLNPRYFFIKSISKCSVEHYFKDKSLPTINYLGQPFRDSYKFFLKNKFYLEECKKLISKEVPLCDKPFNSYTESPKVIKRRNLVGEIVSA